MATIHDNFLSVRKQINRTAEFARRHGDAVQLIAVSKTQDDGKIEEALTAGHRLFGENRVQEAKTRWEKYKPAYPDLKLHLIGPLQTNKVKDAVALFDVIETIDRENLIDEVVKEQSKQQRDCAFFVQVNTGDEEQKAGVSIDALPALLDYAAHKGLKISGLMCIPPVDQPSGLHFVLLKNLAEKYGLKELSMGMSGDYNKAVMSGATFVRVGTAIFGER